MELQIRFDLVSLLIPLASLLVLLARKDEIALMAADKWDQ